MELDRPTVQKITEIESLIRRDPGRRGLLRNSSQIPDALGRGELQRAVESLVHAKHVIILTGFFVPAMDSIVDPIPADEFASYQAGAAETDGPLGTALLAAVLADLGIQVTVVTDSWCIPVVQKAVETCIVQYLTDRVSWMAVSIPSLSDASEMWKHGDFSNASHILAIERVGPSYVDIAEHQFARFVSAEFQDKCFNMRGQPIDRWSAGLHRLFESAPSCVTRLAVGDGGNEIGMGKFGWKTIANRLAWPDSISIPDHDADAASPNPSKDRISIACRIPCRISADHTIIAGVSNWGAYGLTAGLCLAYQKRGVVKITRSVSELLQRHDEESQSAILNAIVNSAGAVDGVTRLAEPTVDGLPFETYIQTWTRIREIVFGCARQQS